MHTMPYRLRSRPSPRAVATARRLSWTLLALLAVTGCGSDAPPPRDDGHADLDARDDGHSAPDALDDAGDDTVADTTDPAPLPHQREAVPAASGPLLAGVATLALDAPVGISMAGYGARTAGVPSPWAGLFAASEGTHGALWLKALAFEVDGQRLVLLKAPLVFSEDTLTRAMHAALSERHGLDLTGRVIVAATHTHHGPGRFWRVPDAVAVAGIDTFDPEIARLLAGRMADAVAAAVADLAPAEWGHRVVEGWDPDDRVYRDRRPVNDALWGKDPRLTVVAVRRPGGPPLAVVANFAMHGTLLGPSNALYSDDAAGGFEHQLEALLQARYGASTVGLFTQAGGGDAAPAGGHLGHEGEQRAQILGAAGAPAVVDAVAALDWRGDTELAVRSRVIALRHALIYGDSGEFDDARGEAYAFGTMTCTIDPEEGLSQRGGPKQCVGVAGLFAALGLPLPHADVNQTWLTVARLGDLLFLTLPGEPTHSIAAYAREQVAALTGDHDVMVVGYSQDHLLYLTHPDDWYLGEYEAEFSTWGPWAGRYLVDRQVELVEDLLGGFNGPVFYEEVPDLHAPLSAAAPRALEASATPGAVHAEPPAEVARLAVLRVTVGGGDPALGAPVFTIERAGPGEDGAFVAVAEPEGRAGRALDSAHPQTLTLYRPVGADGEPNAQTRSGLVEVRDHRWELVWQVPPSTPAGTYRVVASGRALAEGAAEVGAWSAATRPFEVVADPGATLSATRVTREGGEALELAWTHPAVPLERDGRGAWPVSGWWVFDVGARASERGRLKAALMVQVRVDGVDVGEAREATWDEAVGRQVVSLEGLEIGAGAVSARAWVAGDEVPAALEAVVE